MSQLFYYGFLVLRWQAQGAGLVTDSDIDLGITIVGLHLLRNLEPGSGRETSGPHSRNRIPRIPVSQLQGKLENDDNDTSHPRNQAHKTVQKFKSNLEDLIVESRVVMWNHLKISAAQSVDSSAMVVLRRSLVRMDVFWHVHPTKDDPYEVQRIINSVIRFKDMGLVKLESGDDFLAPPH
ncbi:hypothetical protein G7046_g501 [Stylonectria norvegica]|nr:hypothetical protein G7046_g501 [Stylonectria norvegica]